MKTYNLLQIPFHETSLWFQAWFMAPFIFPLFDWIHIGMFIVTLNQKDHLYSYSILISTIYLPFMYYLHSCTHFEYRMYFIKHPGHSFSLRRKQSWHFSSVIFESPKDERKGGVLFVQKKIHSSKIQLRLKSCCFLTTAYCKLQLLL